MIGTNQNLPNDIIRYGIFHSVMIENYPMMLLWDFSLGIDRNLAKLTQWCYYGIFHSKIIGTYQILLKNVTMVFFTQKQPKLTKPYQMMLLCLLPLCFVALRSYVILW
jgi:hypothetical protein